MMNYQALELYLKFTPGGEYLNFTISGFSEMAAHFLTGLAFNKLGPRVSMIIAQIFSLAGGIGLLFMDHYPDNIALIAVIIAVGKFGGAMAQCVCYIATPFLFPVLLCGTAFGICNFFGRLMQASASFIVE